MSYEEVKEHYNGVDLGEHFVEREYIGDTVEHTAEAIEGEPEGITKTMPFTQNGELTFVIMAEDAKVNKKMKMNSKKAELLMASVSLAWGSSYLLMKIGLSGIEPFNLIALRFGIAFICMTLLFLPRFRGITVSILAKGSLMGVLLFLLFFGLVYGVNHTTASTAGFLASTTVIIVPILQSIIKRKFPSISVLSCILVVVIGLYLLTIKDSFSLDKGSVYCLLAALFYVIYIIVFDRIAKNEDTLLISILQLGVAGLLGALFMVWVETPSLPKTPIQWGAILCLGLICSAYGFVVQPMAQRYTSPEKIGLIFSLEPVFSAILSFIFLHEILNMKGYIGAVLIFSGVVLSKITKTKANVFMKKDRKSKDTFIINQ